MHVIVLTIILTMTFTSSIARANTFQYFDTADRDEFFEATAQLGPTTTIDFFGLPKGTPIDTQFVDLGIEFGPNVVISETPSALDGFAIRGIPVIEMTFSEPQYWFAADFIGSGNIAEFFWRDEHLIDISFPVIFTGVIMDKPFDRVVFDDPGDLVAVIDNVYFGAPLTVPAPGVLAVLLAGMTSGTNPQGRRNRRRR